MSVESSPGDPGSYHGPKTHRLGTGTFIFFEFTKATSVCVCTRLLRMNSALRPRPTLEDDDEDVSSTSLVLGLSKFSFLIYNHQAPLYKMPLGFDSNHIHTVGAL